MYSLGCNGDVMWEMDVRKRMPRAEMHVFGPITHKGWGTKVKQVCPRVFGLWRHRPLGTRLLGGGAGGLRIRRFQQCTVV